MRGYRKCFQMGSNFDNVFFLFIYFLVNEERKDLNTTVNGPSSARQGNAISWRTDDDSTLNAGLVAL